ncbi:MAG: hypothetical protein O3B95_10470 [Chloroflexi bacterium]|nr:hypothetical protein [Chloroflexota bacterium]
MKPGRSRDSLNAAAFNARDVLNRAIRPNDHHAAARSLVESFMNYPLFAAAYSGLKFGSGFELYGTFG